MLGSKSRRNWRRNQTRNPSWPCRQTVPEPGTTSAAGREQRVQFSVSGDELKTTDAAWVSLVAERKLFGVA